MQFKLPRYKPYDGPPERRRKVFALFPWVIYYNGERYFIWLTWFYQVEEYWGKDWRIRTRYPVLPETTELKWRTFGNAQILLSRQ